MEEISYIPILKTKRAEYSAITQLDSLAKSKIIPFFEIEPTPLDPDTEIPDKTYNELLMDFGKKYPELARELIVYIWMGFLSKSNL